MTKLKVTKLKVTKLNVTKLKVTKLKVTKLKGDETKVTIKVKLKVTDAMPRACPDGAL